MSKQAAEFVDGWIHQNLTYLDRGGDFIRAMELADKCRSMAATLDIVIDETEGGIGVIETIIHHAMRYGSERPND